MGTWQRVRGWIASSLSLWSPLGKLNSSHNGNRNVNRNVEEVVLVICNVQQMRVSLPIVLLSGQAPQTDPSAASRVFGQDFALDGYQIRQLGSWLIYMSEVGR